jgi:hypothetical protein
MHKRLNSVRCLTLPRVFLITFVIAGTSGIAKAHEWPPDRGRSSTWGLSQNNPQGDAQESVIKLACRIYTKSDNSQWYDVDVTLDPSAGTFDGLHGCNGSTKKLETTDEKFKASCAGGNHLSTGCH